MAVQDNVVPKLFWVVILAFQAVHSLPAKGSGQLVVCEDKHEDIQCPEGTTIVVYDAVYGRTNKRACPYDGAKDMNCKSKEAAHLVRQKCENKTQCHLEATNNWFGDPCPNTYKYLQVDYECTKALYASKSEIVCESKTKKISCPEGMKIKVKDASYGRKDKYVCPNQNVKDTNCRAENSLYAVKERCEDKKECHLEASNNWFKDPCPGTHKYLSVDYQCVGGSSNLKTSTICESKSKKIKCPRGSSLIIEDAFYGRTDKHTCPHDKNEDTECKAENAYQIVSERCNHKAECELQSSNKLFGDPCHGTHKYLQIKYKCA